MTECPDCGDELLTLSVRTREAALQTGAATCPNLMHRTFRFIWKIPAP